MSVKWNYYNKFIKIRYLYLLNCGEGEMVEHTNHYCR